MNHQNLKDRTKLFAINVIKFVRGLPKNEINGVLGRQLLRAGTSVGANYRSASRSRSTPDFVAKMTIVEEEADECSYWMELLTYEDDGLKRKALPLWKEANELTAIAVASINTARGKKRSADA
jgi:four helix bundle protein